MTHGSIVVQVVVVVVEARGTRCAQLGFETMLEIADTIMPSVYPLTLPAVYEKAGR